jgi:hypothetical protein
MVYKNAARAKHNLMAHPQFTGKYKYNWNIVNKSFQDMCLRTLVTNQNDSDYEIEKRINLKNAKYHSVLDILSSCVLSECDEQLHGVSK